MGVRIKRTNRKAGCGHVQLSLFDVAEVYAGANGKPIGNAELYDRLADKCGIPRKAFTEREPVGKAQQPVSTLKRKIRWWQQDLRSLGVLEKTSERGVWTYSGKNRTLKENVGHVSLCVFSTGLGVAIWGVAEKALQGIETNIDLVLSSPPYPLRVSREYGNPNEAEYIDFICYSIEPLVKRLSASGSLCLNTGNDIFLPGMPARSLYQEKLTIALCERFGLYKMDHLVWNNGSKPPGPVQWASLSRQQLNSAYEAILWFSPSPSQCKANNRRVLEAHSEKHMQFLRHGTRGEASFSDGAHRKRRTSYPISEGRIPRNVLSMSHTCASQNEYKRNARSLGLPVHGAPFPLRLPLFLIDFLTEKGDLVIDPFAGSCTTGVAAEMRERRWVCIDKMLEYLLGASTRFRGSDGLALSPWLRPAV